MSIFDPYVLAIVSAFIASSLIWSRTQALLTRLVARRVLMLAAAAGGTVSLFAFLCLGFVPPSALPLAFFAIVLSWLYSGRCFFHALLNMPEDR